MHTIHWITYVQAPTNPASVEPTTLRQIWISDNLLDWYLDVLAESPNVTIKIVFYKELEVTDQQLERLKQFNKRTKEQT